MEKLKAIANKLDGVEYRMEDQLIEELFPGDELQAAGIVIVFGASDDLVEIRGAVNNEIDAWKGGKKTVRHFNGHFVINAEWLSSKHSLYPCWRMTPLDREFAQFEIFERGQTYCIGSVFYLGPPTPAPASEPEPENLPEKKKVEIVTNGAGEFKEYRLMLVDGSELFSMFFDSAAAARAYGEKQGYSVAPFTEVDPGTWRMEKVYSPAEIAEKLGCSAKWIHRLAPELIDAGMAQRVGRALVVHLRAVEYIRNRPDGRGRPALNKKAK